MGLYYDFYKGFCVCPGDEVYLAMRDLEGDEVSTWPVTVYNVNEEVIGVAANKEQYISIWNSDPANNLVGTLTDLIGPFSFKLINIIGTIPPYVIGVPSGTFEGIYESQYAIEYE